MEDSALELGSAKILEGISLFWEISAAQMALNEYADYVVIRDSVSSYGNERGQILHRLNDLEFIVAVPRSKINGLPPKFFGREEKAMESFRTRGNPNFKGAEEEANLVSAEGTILDYVSPNYSFLKSTFFPYNFVYKIVESESFRNFSLLKEGANLVWHERKRNSAGVVQGYDFKGSIVYAPLRKTFSAKNGIELYVQPALANSARGKCYYGGLQTTLLLPSIIVYEKEKGLVRGLREEVWKSFMEQFFREREADKQFADKYHPLNVFDTRHRGGWISRGDNYVKAKFKEYSLERIASLKH